MTTISSFRLLCLLGALLILSACTPTRFVGQHPDFHPEQIDRVAVAFTYSSDLRQRLYRFGVNPEWRDSLANKVVHAFHKEMSHFAEVAEIQHLELTDEDIEEVIGVYHQVMASIGSDLRNGGDIRVAVPSELTQIGEERNVRYVVALRAIGWEEASPEERATRAALNTISIGAAILGITPFAIVSIDSKLGLGLEVMLYDTQEAQVLWYGQHYADLSPLRDDHVQALMMTLLYEMYHKERLSAFTFLQPPSNMRVTIRLRDGRLVSGRIQSREGFTYVLRRDDGEEELIEHASIRFMIDSSGERLIPTRRRSAQQRVMF